MKNSSFGSIQSRERCVAIRMAACVDWALQWCITFQSAWGKAIQRMLSSINRQYTQVAHSDDFVTMLLIKIDVASHQLTYASAGHEMAWLRNGANETQELVSTGLVLGVLENVTWTSQTLKIATGDRLLMVTDGATENRSSQGQLYGRPQVGAILSQTAGLSVYETVNRIDHLLTDFREGNAPSDDITVLLVEVGN